MKANTALKYRLYPTGDQKKYIDTTFDIYRKCWNEFLAFYNKHQEENEDAKHSESFKLALSHVRGFRKQPEQSWSFHINSRYIDMMTQYALNPAFKKWFDALKDGSVKRARVEYIERCKKTGKEIKKNRLDNFYKPKFKSWKNKQSVSFDNKGGASISFEEKVFIPHKICGAIKFKIRDEDKIYQFGNCIAKRFTVTKTKSGKYYLSVSMHNPALEEVLPTKVSENIIGVNLGVRRLVMLSNGEIIDNPKYYDQSLERLQRIGRKLSRQLRMNGHKMTANAEKTRIKLAKAHERVANLRKDHTHRVTDQLVNTYDVVCIQKYDNKAMHKKEVGEILEDGSFRKNGQERKTKITRSLLDANFFEFKRQLEYKAEQRGKKVVVIESDYPATKTCSVCGFVKDNININKVEWQCDNCGTTHDLDKNHAINVLHEGLQRLAE